MATADPPPETPPGQPARDYVFAGLAALLVVFVGMTLRGGVLAGLAAPVLGAAALVFRWTAVPIVFLFLLAYLLVFPFGLPYATAGVNDTLGSHFRVQDMLLVAAVLVYFVCLYRSLGLTYQAMPNDTPDATAPKAKRPAAAVPAGEFPGLFLIAAGCVVAGQLVWLLVTSFVIDFRYVPPLRSAPTGRFGGPGGMPPALARVVLLAGLVTLGGLAARFAFWYWRLSRLTGDEARMLLQDTGWRESRRELNRQAKWRAWGRSRGRRPGSDGARGSWWIARWVLNAVLLLVMLFVFIRLLRPFFT